MADTLQGLSVKMQGTKTLRERLTAWDSKSGSKAPLTDKQKDSFMDLTTQSSNRAFPLEVDLSPRH